MDAYCGGYATPCLLVVAQVDECTGAPIPGQTAYAFDGVRAVSWEPNVEEGERADWKDSCGNIVCSNNENCDQPLGYNLEFEKCVLPFELVNLLTGQPIVTDAGEVIGWYDSSEVRCQPRVAVFAWTKTLGCTTEFDYRVTVFPFVRFSIPTPGSENDLITFATLAARADRGYLANFGEGPFDNVPLGWELLGANVKGSIGEWVTNEDPPVAQCGLLTVGPATPVPALTAVYDEGDDQLIIQSDIAAFTGADKLNYVGTNTNGTVLLPDFTVDSNTQITVPLAGTVFTSPNDITEIVVLDGAVELATWTGSVTV